MNELACNEIVAVIDIGTHSIGMLVARINPDLSYTILHNEEENIRIGENVFLSRQLQPSVIQLCVAICTKYAEMASSIGAVKILPIATSAIREARNKNEFICQLKENASLDVRAISGREEARLTYLGVIQDYNLKAKQALIIDIGGGSTEIIVGDEYQYQFLDSIKLGAIRLTSQFFLPGENGPIPPARYTLMQRYIRNLAVLTIPKVAQYPLDLVIGTSGTINNLAQISTANHHGKDKATEGNLSFRQLELVIDLLCSLPLDERSKVQGLDPDFSDIIVSGAAIIHTLMQELVISKLHISKRGLGEGILFEYLHRSKQTNLLESSSLRERSVLQLGRACNFDEAHARNVSKLSIELFDSAKGIGLHSYGNWERELLNFASSLTM